MTTADYVKAEADAIAGRTGRYIPPYRMAQLMDSAQKITKLLTQTGFPMTYEECGIVLQIVQSALRLVTGKERNK